MRIDTYRGTIARLRGLSIGIVSNTRVRAVATIFYCATIAYCATDMLAKVYIDRYLEHQHNLNATPNNRLSFDQYLFIATSQHLLVKAIGYNDIDRYLLLNAIGLQGYQSMPIAQFYWCSRVSIDTY